MSVSTQPCFDDGKRAGIGKVGAQNVDRDACCITQASRQRFETRFIACDQHEIMPPAGEPFAIGPADSGGSSGK
jgi:hypothetical protein